MNIVIQLLRIKHWIKNLFLLLPAFFGGVLINHEHSISLLLSFLIFSLMASAIYIINDIQDVEHDRKHSVKSKRPIASGKVSVFLARVIFVILATISLIGGFFLNQFFFYVLLIYFISNLIYSFGAKNYSIIDITLVSLGFLFRVIAGSIVVSVTISKWLILLTFLLALFIVLAKRRDDISIKNNDGIITREVSKKYNLEFINYASVMVSSLMIVCYIMYTFLGKNFNEEDNYFIFSSSIFVIIGVLRYYQITFVKNKSGSPTDILYKDNFLQLVLLCWVVVFVLAIYI